VICLVAIGVTGFLYFTKIEILAGSRETAKETSTARDSARPSPAPSATPAPTPALARPAPPPPPSPPPIPSNERFAAETVPFVSERARALLAKDYMSGPDYKAFALNTSGINSFVTGRQNEEDAKTAALEQCQKQADSTQPPRKCELYAVGNMMVYPHGRPPMPPTPWIRRDPATERPFAAKDIPIVRDPGKNRLETLYPPGRKSKTLAIGPGGAFFFNFAADNIEESARRILETCGAVIGVACMIVAADDAFVVPVPTTLKAIGFFRPDRNPSIAVDARDEVARKLADAPGGWNAVAVGTSGRPGLGLKALSEQNAVNEALGNCVKHDSDCHVIAIGPFAVGPN
jgi:hypothetical protein